MSHDPIRKWREDYARRAVNVGFKPLSDAPFHASSRRVFDALRMVQTTFSPGLTFRDAELVKDAVDSFAFLISQSKNIEIVHGHHTLTLGQADATLLSVRTPGSVGAAHEFGYVRVLVPRHELAQRVAHVDDLVLQHVSRRADVLQFLRGYITSLDRSGFGELRQAHMTIRRHIIDLIALAISKYGAVGESRESAVVAARLKSALEYIATRFNEPGLSVATVAEAQGVSSRYLQRLIEVTGTIFTEHVNELRLQRAFSLLAEACNIERRISDIAMDVGFSDISHFNRLFRSRFGETPSGVRPQRKKRE
jgi:AraC-like DNA-binding protein